METFIASAPWIENYRNNVFWRTSISMWLITQPIGDITTIISVTIFYSSLLILSLYVFCQLKTYSVLFSLFLCLCLIHSVFHFSLPPLSFPFCLSPFRLPSLPSCLSVWGLGVDFLIPGRLLVGSPAWPLACDPPVSLSQTPQMFSSKEQSWTLLLDIQPVFFWRWTCKAVAFPQLLPLHRLWHIVFWHLYIYYIRVYIY